MNDPGPMVRPIQPASWTAPLNKQFKFVARCKKQNASRPDIQTQKRETERDKKGCRSPQQGSEAVLPAESD